MAVIGHAINNKTILAGDCLKPFLYNLTQKDIPCSPICSNTVLYMQKYNNIIIASTNKKSVGIRELRLSCEMFLFIHNVRF